MSRLRVLWGFLDRVGWLIAIVFVAVALKTLHDQGNELHANVRTQLVNRATNVESWCGGINETRDYDRLFVKRVSHGLAVYGLPDLPCATLVQKTLESGRHAMALTAKNHPLVWEVLHP